MRGSLSCWDPVARLPKRDAIVKKQEFRKREVQALVRRTYRVCVRTVGVVVLCLAALVMIAALRLMQGPVDLDFLKARIIAAADVPGNETKPEVDRISLEWGGVS